MKLDKIFIPLFMAAALPVMGQKNYNLSYRIETEVTFSNGDNAPYWLSANKFGLGGTKKITSICVPGQTGTSLTVMDGNLLPDWIWPLDIRPLPTYGCSRHISMCHGACFR